MRNIPEDILIKAARIALKANECCHRSDGYEEDICTQIATALLAEREAQRERDAKIADAFDHWDDDWDDLEPESATGRNVAAKMIAERIRSPDTPPTPQDET